MSTSRARAGAAGSCPSTGAPNRSATRSPPASTRSTTLVAGTSWLFAPELADEQLDYLVIDEAGQLSLADALAAGTAARNLILLGDPLQLAARLPGRAPRGTSLSVLAHLLGEHPTVPAERGLFLEQTRRMHPAVCTFISDEVYEHRLKSHPDCALQSVGGEAGIRFLPVEHRGNTSSSPEEVAVIHARDRPPARPPVPGHERRRAAARSDAIAWW